MEGYSIKIPKSDISTIGTKCQICDAFIPIIGMSICDECKKRLKKLLYPTEKEMKEISEMEMAYGESLND